ncbi:MAG: DUF1799 domain-containing protein [Candidatus Accumulibacter sp.]|uniref:DUF1799 domain-containing protein n=1 Tax=Candidatus Accumulibacter affinis TaxID=2954384 RepID=A0A935T9K0_9PROT|nr:DUF1799 domain-containing protein [Candidatus Accumulibacter affinis]
MRIGASADDLPEEICELWPENARPLEVFIAMQTQWALGGMGGVVGLRYESLPAMLDLLGTKKPARREVFAALRVMESAALKVLNEAAD